MKRISSVLKAVCSHAYISINIIIVSLYTSWTSSPFTVKSCSDLCVLLPCPISLSLLCIPWEECRLPEDGKRVAQKQRHFKNYWQSTPWFHLVRGPRLRRLQPTNAIPHNLPSTPNRQHQSIKNKRKSKLSKESYFFFMEESNMVLWLLTSRGWIRWFSTWFIVKGFTAHSPHRSPNNLLAIKMATTCGRFLKCPSAKWICFLMWPPGVGSFSSTHLKKVLGEWVESLWWAVMNVAPRREVTDSASTTLRDTSWLPFFFYTGGCFLCLLFFFGRWVFKNISL